MEDTIKIRKDKIKNVAIVFLAVMLVLTFFSNSILNRALPEVATAYVQYNTITEKVRGNGTVVADDPYKVVVKDTRTIESVAVTVGDEVEKDQILFYLEDAESEELKKARDELEDLELAYMKALFGGNLSSDVINKVANGNTDSFATYQANVTDMQNRVKAAEDRVKECQDNLNAITQQSEISAQDATSNTISDELEKSQAQVDSQKAQAAFDNNKQKQISNLEAQISEIEKQIEDVNALISGSEESVGSGTVSDATDALQTQLDTFKSNLDTKLTDLNNKVNGTFSTSDDAYEWSKNVDWSALDDDGQLALQDFLAAYADYQNALESLGAVTGTASNQEQLNALNDKLNTLNNQLAAVQAITVSSNGDYQDAQNRLNEATKNIAEISTANEQSKVAYQKKIIDATAALNNAKTVYELLKEEQATLASDINAQLDLAKVNKDIAEKKEEIAKLEAESVGATITAPVAGTVIGIERAAGETTEKGETIASIQVAGKGMSLKFSVTNAQAAKVNVGDKAQLQNAWYYNDVMITLEKIKPDPEDPGKKKLLEFTVEGLVQNGENLAVSVGERSAEYEHVVPNSAIREDNKGKFILIIDEKTTPFGNRYKARRMDVEVLASDEINTAVSADLQGYEYVITTSNQPVEAGDQVRLNG